MEADDEEAEIMVPDQLSSFLEADTTTSSTDQVPFAEAINALVEVFDDALLSEKEVIGEVKIIPSVASVVDIDPCPTARLWGTVAC